MTYVDSEPWHLTVVRTQGLRLMRPEKSWRPIVTVEVDKHARHETTMGVDGQNPNLKEIFRIFDAKMTSVIELKVWHKSQSKKKGKKRNIVATSTLSFAELVKRVESSLTSKTKRNHVDVKLSCMNQNKCNNQPSSKGRPQNGAILTLKVQAPTSLNTPLDPLPFHRQDTDLTASTSRIDYSTDSSSSSPSQPASPRPESPTLESPTFINVSPPSPTELSPKQPSPSPSGLRKRRTTKKRLRGYSLLTDDEHMTYSSDSCSSSYSISSLPSPSDEPSCSNLNLKPPLEDAVRSTPLDSCFDSFSDDENGAIRLQPDGTISISPHSSSHWMAPSLLPQHIMDPSTSKDDDVPPYTEAVQVSEPTARFSWWENVLASFTVYEELRDARLDSEFETVFSRMRMEWTFVGTLLAGLAAVDTAVFSISPDSTIQLPPLALRAIASSSIFTGLGISAAAYFILRYSFSPLHVFRTRALDIYSSYVFFSISARVPTLCMAASSLCLMGFLGLVAFSLWKEGVIIFCFLVGIVMSLQFLVYGIHQLGRGVAGGTRKIVGAGRSVVRKMTGSVQTQPVVTVHPKIASRTAGGV